MILGIMSAARISSRVSLISIWRVLLCRRSRRPVLTITAFALVSQHYVCGETRPDLDRARFGRREFAYRSPACAASFHEASLV
jgi:hypothetical protein